MMLSQNFSLAEFQHSDTANQQKIPNKMPCELLPNAVALIGKVLQPLRTHLNKPIEITSGYRSRLLNQIVGSKESSQHRKAEAVDIKIKGMTPAEIVAKIVEVIADFDQCINEYDEWVHVSYKRNGVNRKQVLHFTRGKR